MACLITIFLSRLHSLLFLEILSQDQIILRQSSLPPPPRHQPLTASTLPSTHRSRLASPTHRATTQVLLLQQPSSTHLVSTTSAMETSNGSRCRPIWRDHW